MLIFDPQVNLFRDTLTGNYVYFAPEKVKEILLGKQVVVVKD
jgi:hypothetical protein